MSYENALAVSYNFAAVAFGAGNTVRKLRPPQGKKSGRVSGIHAAATVIFTQVTTQAFIRVGDGTTDDKYAELGLGALASGAARADGDESGSLKASFDLDADSITELELNLVAPTGGTPTGTADVCIVVEWF